MGRRSSSWAGLLDGSSSISPTTTIVRVALIGRGKKNYASSDVLFSTENISQAVAWREISKGGGGIIHFLTIFLFSRTTLKLIEKQERL